MYIQTKAIRKYKKAKCRFTALVTLLCFFTITLTYAFFSVTIDPVLFDTAPSATLNMMNDAINKAQTETAQNDDINYEKMAVISRNEKGEVTSVNVNSSFLNAVAIQINDRAGELIKGKPVKVKVPLGTLTGIDIFSGKGPRMTMKIAQNTTIDTYTESIFESSGINQTLHKIILKVVSHTTLIFAEETFTVDYSADFILAESVIVGNVPSVNMD